MTTCTHNIEEIKKEINERGYYIIRNLLEDEVIESVKQELNTLVSIFALTHYPTDEAKQYNSEPFETRFSKISQHLPPTIPPSLFRKELHRKGFYRLFGHKGLLDVVESIIGTSELKIFPNYSIRPKVPGNDRYVVAWHQDAGLDGDGQPNSAPVQERNSAFGINNLLNIWAPLVPVNVQNGCMEFVPLSHKLGAVRHVRLKQVEADAEKPGAYSSGIDPEIILSEEAEKRAVPIEANPGDVVVFSNFMFHRGLPNLSESIRWSVDWRYQRIDQPTCRKEQGHVVRSRLNPETAVKSAEEWEKLTFM